AMADLLDRFAPEAPAPSPGIHPQAVVEPGASVAPGASVGPFAVIRAGASIGERTVVGAAVSIGRDVVIGADCFLYDHVVIYDHCVLADRVIIHANSVIGADGFGYIFRNGQHRKLRHIGTVVLEEDVEVGACTTIDRAKVGETRIGRGSKIDNHVQVAHNVQIGPLCILAGQVGLSGSVRLGAGCALGGQVGVSDGVRLANGTRIAAQSGIMSDVDEPQQTLMGYPAQEFMTHKRELARIRRLPQLNDRVNALEKKVASLEGAKDH
ncbi:MAG: UDP-3-O-(3-hydroxymyristoyl)glucosamine N-acyltransferase, partial [Phycisphaerales bacterium]|nr:UDP-3-O-(3-hydroxymyristoyl)glucosamine N-acyltransferase [Phycisphaerales bacterium]